MSNVTAPVPTDYNPKWDEFSIPNPSLSSDKWHFTENDKQGLTKIIEGLILLGTLIVTFFLMSRFGPWSLVDESFARSDAGGWSWVGIMALSFVASIFVGQKVSKRTVASRERKRNEYRAQNASLIIDSLNEQGWKIDSNDAVKTIIKDNNPYMLNENGTRYYTRQFHIGREDISFMLTLSDEEVEKDMAQTEKQNQIEFLVSRYEEVNGPMSEEKKSGFEAALNLEIVKVR